MEALKGIKVLDFTHVQSGPTCTQLLAWFGADVIKVERPRSGDPTRAQLVDVPEADSLYFTMLNHNKRSLTLNTRVNRPPIPNAAKTHVLIIVFSRPAELATDKIMATGPVTAKIAATRPLVRLLRSIEQQRP